MTPGQRNNDPYLGYRFQVEIGNLITAGFSDASGVSVETETEEYREGGVNEYVHLFPKGTKYQNIVLKRGITDSHALWAWHRDVVNGKIQRKSGRIILYDQEGNEKWHWVFEGAYPVKWTGPEFKADSGAVAVETLELVHKGIWLG
jgi:phage tail-like protein